MKKRKQIKTRDNVYGDGSSHTCGNSCGMCKYCHDCEGVKNEKIKVLIAITGSPGVGKSALAKFLARKLGFDRLDLHHYYQRISTGYNRSKHSYDINYTKFEKLVKEKLKESKKGLIIDSHLSHLLPKKLVDICIVLICSDLKKLQRRLKLRGYPQNKIRENLDAEIFQVCLMEAKEKGHKVVVFDVSKRISLKKIVDNILKMRETVSPCASAPGLKKRRFLNHAFLGCKK